jgi:hypothetical protein
MNKDEKKNLKKLSNLLGLGELKMQCKVCALIKPIPLHQYFDYMSRSL